MSMVEELYGSVWKRQALSEGHVPRHLEDRKVVRDDYSLRGKVVDTITILLLSHGTMSTYEMMKRTGLSQKRLSDALTRMRERGQIRALGRSVVGRSASNIWELVDD